MRRARRSSVLALLGALGLAAPRADAAPPTKQQCIDADADAQSLRMAGKLRDARDKLAVCADPACPKMVRDDCNQRIDEIERATPTVVFAAKDAAGKDVLGVQVTMDGKPFDRPLDGTAVPVDPGTHTFAFAAAGHASVEQTFVLREGEKNRREQVILASVEPPGTPPPAETSTPRVERDAGPAAVERPEEGHAASWSSQKTFAVVAAGVGLVGVVVGSVFGLMSFSSWSGSKNACSASTPQQCQNHGLAVTDHDAAVSDATTSTVAFAVGLAGLAAAAGLYFTAPSAPATALQLAPAPGGGAILLRGGF